MKNNQILPSLGLFITLGLIFVLLTFSLLQLQSGSDAMSRLAGIGNSRTAALVKMRDTMRRRAGNLEAMRQAADTAGREAAYRLFESNTGEYHQAREALLSLGMDPDEAGIHRQLARLEQDARSLATTAVERLTDESSGAERTATLDMAGNHQHSIQKMLDRLADLAAVKSHAALLDASDEHNRVIHRLLVALAAVTLCIGLVISQTVMRLIAGRSPLPGYRAARDPLTGLINRREFESRVERALKHANAQSATHALLYLDIDQFKVVNDTCGHAAGDELLRQIGQLLLSSLRRRDTLGRLGGDEFGMLLENCPLEKSVEIADNLRRAVSGFRYTRGKATFVLGISIGVVALDRSTTCLARAMSAADSACYVAKESGRNRVHIAQPGDQRLQQRHGQTQWLSRINAAFSEKRFALFFQPIFPCSGPTRHGKHIEILLRMIDDDGSVLAPAIFLPAAEKYRLATRIDRWVITSTLAWLVAQPDRIRRPLTISINLSGQSLCDPAMQKFILDCVEEHAVPPERICFEITETAAIANITAATSFMLSLRGHGFRFTLDDFGSGLSSSIYLKKLPVDFLKIDGTFVRDIMSDPVDRAMVRSACELGQLLGKQTIAECVETATVADELKRMGIDYVQGYAFAQPRSLDDFEHVMGPHLVVISSG